MIKEKLVFFFLFSSEFWQTVITKFHYLEQLFRLALSESNKALTVCLSRPHGETFFTIASTRSILAWSFCFNYIIPYNPLISFCAILSAILGHVVPNRRAGIRQYTPSLSIFALPLLQYRTWRLIFTLCSSLKISGRWAFTSYKRVGSWSRNASRNCFWNRYWRLAGQWLAISSPCS